MLASTRTRECAEQGSGALGGTTLAIECSKIHAGNRGFKQTGQLGDVMQESAQIA